MSLELFKALEQKNASEFHELNRKLIAEMDQLKDAHQARMAALEGQQVVKFRELLELKLEQLISGACKDEAEAEEIKEMLRLYLSRCGVGMNAYHSGNENSFHVQTGRGYALTIGPHSDMYGLLVAILRHMREETERLKACSASS